MRCGSVCFKAAIMTVSSLAILFLCSSTAAGQGHDGMYIRGGAGALFSHPPGRDSLPFYATSNAVPGPVGGRTQTELGFKPESDAFAGELAFG